MNKYLKTIFIELKKYFKNSLNEYSLDKLSSPYFLSYVYIKNKAILKSMEETKQTSKEIEAEQHEAISNIDVYNSSKDSLKEYLNLLDIETIDFYTINDLRNIFNLLEETPTHGMLIRNIYLTEKEFENSPLSFEDVKTLTDDEYLYRYVDDIPRVFR